MVKFSRVDPGRFYFMKRLFRTPDISMDRDPELKEAYKVAVVGCCEGAGASFVSSCVLQHGLFEDHIPEGLRTLCETGKGYFYLALGFDKRFAGRDFRDFSSHGKHELNMELGYNWYVLRPGEGPAEDRDILRKLYNAAGSFIVYDCSGLIGRDILWDILGEADMIYLVIDPMPTKLISSRRFIDGIRARYPETELVVNRFAKGIHRGELSKFLETRDYHTLPCVPIEKLYRAEYNCLLADI